MLRPVIAVVALALPFAAFAQEWLPEEELFGYDPAPDMKFDPAAPASAVQLVKGVPGDLTFDVEVGQGLLDVPKDVREFDSMYSYIEFVGHELNGLFDYDEAGVPVGFSLETHLTAPTWYFDDDTGDYVYVTRPLAAYLGGRFGYVLVGGEQICVDPDLCGGNSLPNDVGFYYTGPEAGVMSMAASSYGYNPSKYSIRVTTWAKSNYNFTWRDFATCTTQGNGGRSWRNLKAELFVTDDRARTISHSIKWTNRMEVCKGFVVQYLGDPRYMNVNNYPYNAWGSFGWHYGEGNGQSTSTGYRMCGGSCASYGCNVQVSTVGRCL